MGNGALAERREALRESIKLYSQLYRLI
jgi:hypothetical protein